MFAFYYENCGRYVALTLSLSLSVYQSIFFHLLVLYLILSLKSNFFALIFLIVNEEISKCATNLLLPTYMIME